jgi:hypothetical protein
MLQKLRGRIDVSLEMKLGAGLKEGEINRWMILSFDLDGARARIANWLDGRRIRHGRIFRPSGLHSSNNRQLGSKPSYVENGEAVPTRQEIDW